MLDVKKEGIKVIAGLVVIIALIFAIRIFNIPFWVVFIGLVKFNLVFSIYRKTFTFKGFLINTLSLAGIFGLIILIEPLWGVWSYFLVIFLICSFIVWRKREKWLKVKYHIESMIWGEPIKDLVVKGKWR